MTEHQNAASTGTPRERELEIEVARLQAELDTLRGDDPVGATSRFLEMAAATVDQAVEDARREADEIVEEVSAQAEARRDEATRVAAEAEAMAEQMLADADRAQEKIDEATAEADAIKSAAEQEAAELVDAEHQKVAGEIEALAEVRSALQDERSSLETYHEELHRRVQELAESMVSFMTTELPVGAATAIENLAVPQLETVLDEQASIDPAPIADTAADLDVDTDGSRAVETGAVETSAVETDRDDDALVDGALVDAAVVDDVLVDDVAGLDQDAEMDAEEIDDGADLFVGLMDDAEDEAEAEDEVDDADVGDEAAADESVALSDDPFDAIPTVETPASADDPWTSALESAIPADEAYPDAMTMPESSIDEIPPGPPASFDDREIVEDPMTAAETKPTSSGLFSRATNDETGFEDLAEATAADASDDDAPSTGLFGMLGSRLVQQTSPDDLADALEDDDEQDSAFHEFLAGDEEPDPSRDWLLRPEQG
ncbi:MAG: hypothetical protein AAF548_02885 [Actinomycetota bacterium]